MKVYEGRLNQPYTSEEELKARIEEVWDDVASDVISARKAIREILPRVNAVVERQGGPIKTLFG